MKRVLLVLLLFLLVLCSPALSESFSSHSTGHFRFSAEGEWISEPEDDSLVVTSPKGMLFGQITASEMSCFLANQTPSEFYHDVALGIAESGATNISPSAVFVDGAPGCILSYDTPVSDHSIRVHWLVCYHEGYLLSFAYVNPSLSPEESLNRALSHAELIHFVSSPRLTDEDMFREAATSVYGDRLISSRAGKYPTIDVREYGSARDILASTNEKSFHFLRLIRRYRETSSLQFVDVRINVHTDLIDIYGNTSEVMVLGFNIKAEDIDRINFDKMPVENIPKIAINWYEHPALK